MMKSTRLALTIAALSAPIAFDKAHDQGKDSVLTIEQTKEAAQGLGEKLRAVRGFNNLR